MMNRLRVSASETLVTARFLANIARPRRPLFLLSHMRSYSSLLCHILNTNPDIDGYGELEISYRSPIDLISMRYGVALSTRERLAGQYVLDKLLHRRFELADAIVQLPTAKFMLSIREPEASVRSIVAMGRQRSAKDWKADPQRAAQHYTRRIDDLCAFVERRSDVLAFPADAVTTHPETFLAGLTEWLDLDEPLRPQYRTGRQTGTAGFGDTSAQISSGTINVDRPKHDVELPPDLVDEIWAKYESGMARVLGAADHVLCPEAMAVRS